MKSKDQASVEDSQFLFWNQAHVGLTKLEGIFSSFDEGRPMQHGNFFFERKCTMEIGKTSSRSTQGIILLSRLENGSWIDMRMKQPFVSAVWRALTWHVSIHTIVLNTAIAVLQRLEKVAATGYSRDLVDFFSGIAKSDNPPFRTTPTFTYPQSWGRWRESSIWPL